MLIVTSLRECLILYVLREEDATEKCVYLDVRKSHTERMVGERERERALVHMDEKSEWKKVQ